jgi:hypothetical protein
VLRSIVPDTASLAEAQEGGGKVGVTTLTSMAAALYDSLPANKQNSTAAKQSITNVVKAVYPDLLLNGGIKNVLRAPTVVKNNNTTLDGTQGQYAAVLAGLAQIAKDQNKSPSQLATELASAAANRSIPTSVTTTIVAKTNTYAGSKPGTSKGSTATATPPPADGSVEEPKSEEPTGATGATGGNGATGGSGGQP